MQVIFKAVDCFYLLHCLAIACGTKYIITLLGIGGTGWLSVLRVLTQGNNLKTFSQNFIIFNKVYARSPHTIFTLQWTNKMINIYYT